MDTSLLAFEKQEKLMDSLNFMLIVRDIPKAIELKRLKIDEQIYTRLS